MGSTERDCESPESVLGGVVVWDCGPDEEKPKPLTAVFARVGILKAIFALRLWAMSWLFF